MKDSMTFEEQVEQIAEALLADFPRQKSKTEFRVLRNQYLSAQGATIETRHGVQQSQSFRFEGSAASLFDPVPIADILKRLGDQFNADLERPAQEVIEQIRETKGRKFKENVETLSKAWIIQNPELEYEKAFLLVAVKLFVYIAKKAQEVARPRLFTEAINGTPEVRHYIERQGGWENFENRRRQNNP